MCKSALDRIKAKAKTQSKKNIEQSSNEELVIELNIDSIKTNPYQPRKKFDEVKIKELADSIKESGLIQPVSIAKKDGMYILIAGERRIRAHKLLGFKKIKVNILDNIDDNKLKELSLIENIQRDDLSLMEESIAYNELKKDGFSLREIAKKTGKSKTRIGEIIKLLNFDEECIEYISENKISVLSTLINIVKLRQKDHMRLLKKLKDNNLSLLQSEKLLEKQKEDLKETIVKEKEYPFSLPKISGVDIKQSKNKLNISIDIKNFNVEDDIEIVSHINSIINKLKNTRELENI